MLDLIYVGDATRHPVNFQKLSDHVVSLKSDNLPISESGFYLCRTGKDDYWDYTKYVTVYRRLEGIVQYSNDGSVWIDPPEPTRTVTLSVNWDDGGNVKGIRPKQLLLKTNVKEIVLSEERGWVDTIADVPVSQEVVINEVEEVADYECTIEGTTVFEKTDYILPDVPTIEQRVSDLEEAVCELAELL